MKKIIVVLTFIGLCMGAINSTAQSTSPTTDNDKSVHRNKEHHDGKAHPKGIHLFHHGHKHHGKNDHRDHGKKGDHDGTNSKDKQRSSKK